MIHNVLIDFMLFVVHVTPVTDCNDVSHNKCHLLLSNAQQLCTKVNDLQKSISVRASVDRSANIGCPVLACPVFANTGQVRKHRLSGVCCHRAAFPAAEIVPRSTSMVSTLGTQWTSHRTSNWSTATVDDAIVR